MIVVLIGKTLKGVTVTIPVEPGEGLSVPLDPPPARV